MKFAYYPGCSLHSTAKEYDISTRVVCKELGIELQEIPDWICCGSTPAHNKDFLLSLALPISNCIWAEKEGLDIIAPCASCYSRLKISSLEVKKDRELLERVNMTIDADYQGKINILSPLQVFSDRQSLELIMPRIKRDLSSLKVACYYGCLFSRPKEVTGIEDVENPDQMDRIMESIGAESIDWSHKTECCGASLAITQSNICQRLVGEIMDAALYAKADCIAVACPLCQSNLDLRQQKGGKSSLPIFYITQLIGLALGISPSELGLRHLVILPHPLLLSKGIINRSEIWRR
ncbi:MAG: CoB--CoM heterodisulfide reductase iron-sulfur subunit B family protein [bacterium]